MFEEFFTRLQINMSITANNKYGCNIGFPHSNEIYIRKDYVSHRLGAVNQQLYFLQLLVDKNKQSYSSLNADAIEKIDFTRSSIEQLTYCFENLVFNLASMTDYFGNYLGFFIYGPKHQSIKWNGFVNKTKSEYSETDFGLLVSAEHKGWFNRLHNFRGDIIHKKAILIEVEGFNNSASVLRQVNELNFKINDALNTYFHLIRSSKNRDLYYCAEKMCKRTFEGFYKIMAQVEAIDFDSSFKGAF